MKAPVALKTMDMASIQVRISDLFELAKPRIAVLSLITTLAGFYMATKGPLDFVLAANVVVGTALVAAGASAFNHLFERELDAQMERTQDRPLPSGRMTPGQVTVYAVVASIAGVIYLAITTTLLAAACGLVTLVLYVFVYTPMKRVTPLNTMVGAIPGALPPMIGWTAVTNEFSHAAWVLFAILYIWQIPHFMAIAWLYREQYANAGFKMVSVDDPGGVRTSREIIFQTLALLAISLLPTLLGVTGKVYFFAALVLGLGFLASASFIVFNRTDQNARRLLLASVIYLPLLLTFMVIDKV